VVTKRQVAVLGLGRFGQAVARELTRLGHEVLAVDASERVVQEVLPDVTHAAQADVADEDALRELGLRDFHTVVIAITSNLEASILATALVRRLGVGRILAKAGSPLHGSILQQVGATRVVYPELETGMRVAHSFAAPAVQDYLDVAPGYGIAKAPIPLSAAGKSLGDVGSRADHGVTVLALHRSGEVTLNPPPGELLQAGDELIVAGRDEDLEHLSVAGAPP
jgi:trk system potassium uptake protein TrkA